MHRPTCSLCVVLLAALGVLPAFAAGAEPRPRSVLAEVAALEKRVTYTETKIPLGELVQKVAADTGATLTAAKEVADEPVAVVVRELPARELLEQLADLLDYRWRSRAPAARSRLESSRLQVKTDTDDLQPANLQLANLQPATILEIWQDLASKQREEALRRGVVAEAEQRFREEVAEAVAMAALPPEQIQAMVAAAEQHREALKKLPREERRARQATPEEQEQERRASLAQRLAAPIPRALAELVGRLTPREWDQLRQGQELVLSSDPEPGELRLPERTVQSFRAATPHSAWIRMDDPELGDAASVAAERQREQEMQQQWAAARGYRVGLRLDASAIRTSAAFNLLAFAQPIPGVAPKQPELVRFGEEKSLILSGASQLWPAEPPPEEAQRRRAAFEPDPVLGVRRPLVPRMKAHSKSPEAGGGPVWQLGELLPDLARTYTVDFISNAYWATSVVGGPLWVMDAPAALFEWLDRFWGQEHQWERAGRLIRIRSRTWFLDRSHEVPLRLVRRWKKLWDESGALPLDEYVNMASTLSEDQRDGIYFVNQAVPLSRDVYDLRLAWHALRLYAALSTAQRQALWQGRALSVARMTPEQRDRFMAYFRYDWERHRYQARLPKPAELAVGSFSLTTKPGYRIREQSADLVRYRDASESQPRASSPAKAPEVRRPVLELTFLYQYGRQSRDTAKITVASAP